MSLDAVEEMTLGYPEPVTKSHLSRIENGLAAPTFARMYALSQVYGVPIATLAERFEIDIHRRNHTGVADLPGRDRIVEALVERYHEGDMLGGLALADAALETFGDAIAFPELSVSLRFHRIVFLSRLERFETAKIEAEELLSELPEGIDELWRFKILRSFVQCCYRLGRHTIARMGLESLGAKLDGVPTDLRAHLVHLRASVAYSLGDMNAAAADFLEAGRLFEEVADTYDATLSRLNLAQCYIALGKRREPHKLLTSSLEVAEQQGFHRFQALALGHLCELSLAREDLDAAAAYAMRSNAIARPREFVSIVFRNCYHLRAIAAARGDEQARRANERSLRALLNRADQELDIVRRFRSEVEGESR